MNLLNDEHLWERSRQFVPNKRESMLRLIRWRKLRKSNRKRKSAFSFWWGPVLICGLSFAGFIATAVKLSYKHPAVIPLPEAGLYMVHATAKVVEQLQRVENVRRQALALSDAEVGISLDAELPDPLAHVGKAVAFDAEIAPEPEVYDRGTDAYLPQMYTPRVGLPCGMSLVFVADAALTERAFTATLPYFQDQPQFEEARFQVVLNETGHVIEILRFAPAGAETTQLRQVREALLKGYGNGPASGEIRVFWKTRIKR
jgi:hypothetical protein